MAMFKVGQRVRIIGGIIGGGVNEALGREATVISELHSARYVYSCEPNRVWMVHSICIDGIGSVDEKSGLPISSPAEWLAPLTNPGADAFIERLKKLAREPAPALPDKLIVTNSTRTVVRC